MEIDMIITLVMTGIMLPIFITLYILENRKGRKPESDPEFQAQYFILNRRYVEAKAKVDNYKLIDSQYRSEIDKLLDSKLYKYMPKQEQELREREAEIIRFKWFNNYKDLELALLELNEITSLIKALENEYNISKD